MSYAKKGGVESIGKYSWQVITVIITEPPEVDVHYPQERLHE